MMGRLDRANIAQPSAGVDLDGPAGLVQPLRAVGRRASKEPSVPYAATSLTTACKRFRAALRGPTSPVPTLGFPARNAAKKWL
jgi:hypothetical protein